MPPPFLLLQPSGIHVLRTRAFCALCLAILRHVFARLHRRTVHLDAVTLGCMPPAPRPGIAETPRTKCALCTPRRCLHRSIHCANHARACCRPSVGTISLRRFRCVPVASACLHLTCRQHTRGIEQPDSPLSLAGPWRRRRWWWWCSRTRALFALPIADLSFPIPLLRHPDPVSVPADCTSRSGHGPKF